MEGIGVTGDARCRRFPVGLGFVATRAFDTCVPGNERESRQIMIKRNLAAPFRLAMATLASLAELAFVGIVLRVTGVALPRHRSLQVAVGVAGVAFDLRMRAIERKARCDFMPELNVPP
ncbi:MAG: hypothetical protein R3D44_13505 [Hyphomicrobiaceae bacterium]